MPEEAPSAAAPVRKPEYVGGPRRRGLAPQRRKVCRFCVDSAQGIDYKQIHLLRTYVSETGRILAGRMTGNCTKHQRQLTRAIKRARNMALLPYTGS